MNFRTEITPAKALPIISHHKPVMLIGSCFTENIGNKLKDAMFDVTLNPWGILYNPVSIAAELNAIIDNAPADKSKIFEYNGLFHSFDHHSAFSAKTFESVESRINDATFDAHVKLKTASALIITFGSATVFKKISDGEIVGNCHKLPANLFVRESLEIGEVVNEWSVLIKKIFDFNRDINIVFTVSPIRYKAYGMHGTQLDKARLLLIIDKLQAVFSGDEYRNRLQYFPSYEILMDDLRDYRFYAPDMIHPSEMAVEYIYDIFSRQFFSNKTMAMAVKCENLTKRLKHRFMTDNEAEIEKFKVETDKIKLEIEKELQNEI